MILEEGPRWPHSSMAVAEEEGEVAAVEEEEDVAAAKDEPEVE